MDTSAFDNHTCTLREASATDDVPPKYCLASGYAAGIKAIHFEKVMDDWMNISERLKNDDPCPHTVDALYRKDDTWYLIEFKNNEKTTLAKLRNDLQYKAYDSVLQIVEHGLRTVGKIRASDFYIVVAALVGGMTDADLENRIEELGADETGLMDEAIFGIDISSLLRPWLVDPPPVDAHLDRLNNVLYKTALTLTPMQFNLFAKEHGWI